MSPAGLLDIGVDAPGKLYYKPLDFGGLAAALLFCARVRQSPRQ